MFLKEEFENVKEVRESCQSWDRETNRTKWQTMVCNAIHIKLKIIQLDSY